MSRNAVALLRDLFIARDDAYGEQWINAERGDSGYTKASRRTCPGQPCVNPRCEHRVTLAINDTVIRDHLSGRKTIGVYQLSDDDNVKWLCLDIDKDKTLARDIDPAEVQANAQEQVRRLVKAFLPLGIKPVVEDSGNRGYHVWVFFNSPIPASIAQTVGHFVLEQVPVLAGLHIELFPKQVSARSLGNLVKLPLGVHLKSKRRSAFVNREFEPFSDQIDFLSHIPRHDLKEMQAIIDWYNLKPAEIRRLDVTTDNSGLGRRVPLCLIRLLNEGVGDGMRDIATFKIACYLRDRGLPEDLTQTTLEAWDERNKPPLTSVLISQKVSSAYSDAYGYLPCFDPVFDSHCSSKCEHYAMKQERRTSSTRIRTS